MKQRKTENYLFPPGSQDKCTQGLLHGNDGKSYFCGHIGSSMHPTLSSLDLLEIEPYNTDRPMPGDVVLCRPPGQSLVVHRVLRISGGGFLTRGDNCSEADPWILGEKEICGRVVAAHRKNTRRMIAGGTKGMFQGSWCQAKRMVTAMFVKIFRSAYRALCSDGWMHWLIPVRLTPHISIFRSSSTASHRLLLGKRVIGIYDESLLRWQIHRPYRILVDESSLPKPPRSR